MPKRSNVDRSKVRRHPEAPRFHQRGEGSRANVECALPTKKFKTDMYTGIRREREACLAFPSCPSWFPPLHFPIHTGHTIESSPCPAISTATKPATSNSQ